jgi:hypothetical protein
MNYFREKYNLVYKSWFEILDCFFFFFKNKNVLNLWHSTVVGNFACLLHVRIKHARGGNLIYIYYFVN